MRVNLAEEPIEAGELAVAEDGFIQVELGPWQLATVAIGFDAA